jgi:hypothetical protein
MVILHTLLVAFLVIYFTIGVIYGIYVLYKATDPWYLLPWNILGGPIMLVIIYIWAKRDKYPKIGS